MPRSAGAGRSHRRVWARLATTLTLTRSLTRRGEGKGKVRDKLTDVHEMLRVAGK